MTLLLSLISKTGVHQSSDYRLTNTTTRQKIDDELGSKQVDHHARDRVAQISFTGIASVGSRRTRDWILNTLTRTNEATDARTAISALSAAAEIELGRVPPRDRVLTIVATIRDKTTFATRVFVVSRTDFPDKPPGVPSLDHFEVIEISTDTPRELIFGYIQSVSKADRKFLRKLNTGKYNESDIRRNLAEINSRSAKSSRGLVSEGCLVSSMLPDGSSALENFGRAAGVVRGSIGSREILDLLSNTAKGAGPVFVQGRGGLAKNAKQLTLRPMNVTAGNTLLVAIPAGSGFRFVTDSAGNTYRSQSTLQMAPINVDEEAQKLAEGLEAGETHKISFSSTSGRYNFLGPDRSFYGTMLIEGLDGAVEVVKNRVIRATLARVQVLAASGFDHSANSVMTNWDVATALTVDGSNVHGWGYTSDMIIDKDGAAIGIRFNSAALRSSEVTRFPWMKDSEELAVISALYPARLHLSKETPTLTGSIEGYLFLREINQVAENNPIENRSRKVELGRNSPCPCGSGKRFKRCCGST